MTKPRRPRLRRLRPSQNSDKALGSIHKQNVTLSVEHIRRIVNQILRRSQKPRDANENRTTRVNNGNQVINMTTS